MSKAIARCLLAVIVVTTLFSGRLFACACCSEPGAYHLYTSKPDGYYLDLVNEFRYSKFANLYETEAGFDMIKGLARFEKEMQDSEDLSLPSGFNVQSIKFVNKAWRFDLKTRKGTAGSLVLPLPLKMVEFKVDIHDGSDQGLGPLLYKEFRFKGNVSSATGFARDGFARGTTYFLVFQGRGRGCNEVTDFTHWRLEIEGPKASYALYGKLESSQEATALQVLQ